MIPLGHPGGGSRRQAIDADIVPRPFQCQRLHQPDQRHLGGAVVGLAEIAVQPRRRRRHHDASIVLRPHDIPYGLGAIDRAHQVNVDHRTEIRQPHLCEGFVAQVAGIVDQDVHAPPGIDRLLDHGFDGRLVGHRCAIPDRLAASCANLLRHAFCRSGATAGAVARAAQIIESPLLHRAPPAPGHAVGRALPRRRSRLRPDP
jgi:hypothetical protein